MHGIFRGQLMQSELGRYGSELLLGRTVEPDPGQADRRSSRGRSRWSLEPASDTAARRSPSTGELVDDLLALRQARAVNLRAVTSKAT
jgi:hypothetical protein